MNSLLFKENRNSYMDFGLIYFWTATINSWIKLLETDQFKKVILNSLTYLSEEGKIDVFSFVIMPSHIHLIWRINEINRKENPQGSFLKFTAHHFKNLLSVDKYSMLPAFKVKAPNKQYEFWQRDPLAIHLYSKEVAYQKLDYIHNNPLADHWQLATLTRGLFIFLCFILRKRNLSVSVSEGLEGGILTL